MSRGRNRLDGTTERRDDLLIGGEVCPAVTANGEVFTQEATLRLLK